MPAPDTAQQQAAGTGAIADGGARHLGPHLAIADERHQLQSILATPPQQPGQVDGAQQATVAAQHLPRQAPQAIVTAETEAHGIGEGIESQLAGGPQVELPAGGQPPGGGELGSQGPGLIRLDAQKLQLLPLGGGGPGADALQAIKVGVEGHGARGSVVGQTDAGEAGAQPASIPTPHNGGDAGAAEEGVVAVDAQAGEGRQAIAERFVQGVLQLAE